MVPFHYAQNTQRIGTILRINSIPRDWVEPYMHLRSLAYHQHRLDDLAVDVREAPLNAVVVEAQALVIEAEQV